MKQTLYNIVNDTTLQVERAFDGSPEQVWKAWTDPVLLAEWWAPLPFKAVTHKMDFREGGQWHYYMLGPDGSQFWCMVGYEKIEPPKRFTGDDYFCDEKGNKNEELPAMHWDVRFSPDGKHTKVTVTITYASKEDMEKIVSMGFKEGFSMAHENLDQLLQKQVALS